MAPEKQLTYAVLYLVQKHQLQLLYLFPGEYDPAEIHNAGQLRRHMIHVCIHLAWQMVSFFMYLYWSVHGLMYLYWSVHGLMYLY